MNEESEAQFNLAAGTILRIDANLKEVNYFLKNHDLKSCFETLQTVYSEISPFLSPKETTEEDDTENKILININQSLIYSPKQKKYIFMPKNNVEMDLRKWDRRLRKLMLKYKLYMKMSDQRLAATKIG